MPLRRTKPLPHLHGLRTLAPVPGARCSPLGACFFIWTTELGPPLQAPGAGGESPWESLGEPWSYYGMGGLAAKRRWRKRFQTSPSPSLGPAKRWLRACISADFELTVFPA